MKLLTRQQSIELGRDIAKNIIRLHDSNTQPIPLSQEETYRMARAIEELSVQLELCEKMSHPVQALPDPSDAPLIEPAEYPRELEHLTKLHIVLRTDEIGLKVAAKSYGDSWKKRGGVGAFMMLARKWDRFEQRVRDYGYNVFTAIRSDKRREGVIDDIRDLRRYLALVEAHAVQEGWIETESTTKDSEV